MNASDDENGLETAVALIDLPVLVRCMVMSLQGLFVKIALCAAATNDKQMKLHGKTVKRRRLTVTSDTSSTNNPAIQLIQVRGLTVAL